MDLAGDLAEDLAGDFSGRVVLITGASRGLGAACALAFAARGAQVLALARTVGALEELDNKAREAGGRTRVGGVSTDVEDSGMTLIPLDICDSQGVQNLGQSIFDRWGGLDIWVHCAVYAAPLSPVNCLDGADLARSMAVNVTATAQLIGCIDPLLRAKSGVAVCVEDTQAGHKFFGAYGASKAAQSALFASWRAENSVRVCSFQPRPMRTAVRARFFPGQDGAGLADIGEEAERLLLVISD